MRLGTIAFLMGILLCQILADLPAAWWALPIVPLSVLGVKLRLLRFPAFVAAGFLWAVFRADGILSSSLDPVLESRDLTIIGSVASLPEYRSRSIRFEFDIERLLYNGSERAHPARVRLSWYGNAPELTAGDQWQLTARLKRPWGFMNPGGFDYERWLFQNRIRATGYVRADGENVRLESVPAGYPVQRLRQQLSERLERVLASRPHAGIIRALAIGERDGISPTQWEVFNRTATSHLVAISGLHIGLIAALIYFIVQRAWGYLPALALRLPAPQAAASAALLGAGVYAALAGFSIPTQRALVMVAVIMAGVFVRQRVVPGHVLAAAMLIVLLLDPLAVLAGGFWLSFGAVAAILFAMSGRLTQQGIWWKWGRVHVVIAVALAPLLLVLFQGVSLVSPAANLIAVPYVSILVVPATLAGVALLPVPALGAWLLTLAERLTGWLWRFLEWLAGLDIAMWSQHAPPLWVLGPALVGMVWLLAPRGWPVRWLGVLWLLPLIFLAPPRPAPGEAWFTLLDVGQGLAAVVQTRNHALVYDTGARFSDEFNAGSAVVLPYLKSTGIRRIDTLVVSHGDNDHIGGAPALLDRLEVGRLISSVPDRLTPHAAQSCAAGMRWTWDGIDFDVLHPQGRLFAGHNNGSCVLRVSAGSGGVLLPGDIEKPAERWLVNNRADVLNASVIVVPHHGSNTSSTAEFIAAVGPAYALFPVGYRNRYGFPRGGVVERYRAAGAQMLESTRHGAIRFRLGRTGEVTLVDTYRQSARRYWHSKEE